MRSDKLRASGQRAKLKRAATSGRGLRSAKTWRLRTWSASLIGLSTAEVERHRVAVLGQLRQADAHPSRPAADCAPAICMIRGARSCAGSSCCDHAGKAKHRRAATADFQEMAALHRKACQKGHQVFDLLGFEQGFTGHGRRLRA
jgi:hypothetical protein